MEAFLSNQDYTLNFHMYIIVPFIIISKDKNGLVLQIMPCLVNYASIIIITIKFIQIFDDGKSTNTITI